MTKPNGAGGDRMRRWARVARMVSLAILAANDTPALALESPPLLLAQPEIGQADVSLFLVSEKFDGVRAFWDGVRLLTRRGMVINAPDWFTERFPRRALDGELWMGRDQFDRLSATVRRKVPDDGEWRQVRYLVFELPNGGGTFRDRAYELERIVSAAEVGWLRAVEQREVGSRETLEQRLADTLKLGGEGLMLHRADAAYATGRSDILLKMKAWQDADATVIGHRPGKGRYAGMLGSLRVRTADGVEFLLGTGLSEAVRRSPPAVGDVVTFRYRGVTRRGVPRFASFLRIQDF